MKLDDINAQLGTDLDSEDYDSIGGIIIEHLNDCLPTVGETVVLEDKTTLKVESFENNRIGSVRLTLAPLPESNSSAEES